MNNLKRPIYQPDKSIITLKERVTKKERVSKKKKDFLSDEEKRLILLHKEYNDKADNGNLATLKSIWKRPGGKKENKKHPYWISHSLYENIDATEYWEKLSELNCTNDRELICPICGMEPADELDHFAPRQKFPEYSCHYTNLIPLCHKCNKKKSTKWINNSGRQLIFNAFFDTEIPDDTFCCRIEFPNDTPIVEVELSDHLDNNNPHHWRIISTFTLLELADKFKKKVNDTLRNIIATYKVELTANSARYTDMKDFVDSRKQCMIIQLQSKGEKDFLDIALWKACINSTDFWNFVASLKLQ